MKTLLLLRHAKSSWADPSLEDFVRPLNERGRSDAPRMGRWLREAGFLPERVLLSPARRAMETWEGVRAGMHLLPGEEPEVEVIRTLYLAEPEEILRRIHRVDPSVDRTLVVGHNPGFEELARGLTGGGEGGARTALAQKYPTGTLAVLTFPVEAWSQVGWGEGTLLHLIRPRELP